MVTRPNSLTFTEWALAWLDRWYATHPAPRKKPNLCTIVENSQIEAKTA